MSRPGRDYVRARTFDWHLARFEAASPQFAAKEIPDRAFIWSDGFNVDQTSSEGEQVHAHVEESVTADRNEWKAF
jgi:hypothetical protein